MMEKIETMKKSNRLMELLSHKSIKYAVGTALLTGIGILLPRIFHILGGANSGAIFLPMHIAVLLAALTFGTISASIVAGSSVVCSYLLTGMPNLARLPYMLIELLIYAVLLSVCNKKFNSYISLMITIILGRILYAGILWIAVNGLGLPTYGISVIQSIEVGLPGIAIQLICVPFIAKCMKKGIHLDD
ncbi:MAG: ECF transporter S component [Clostridia bacterium]|nr:ECF transporter S component [Clostridia bacterium]